MNNDQVIYPEPDTVSQGQLEPNIVDTQETEVIEEESQDHTPDTQQEEYPSRTESKNDRNWREMRERTERLEKERNDAVNLLRRIEEEALKYQQQQQAPVQKQKEQSILDIDDDEIIEGRHLKALVKQEFEALRKQQTRYEESSIEREIKERYNDWDNVVNHETVKRLNEEYPDIAYSLSLNNDLKKKATSTYTIMKKLGIAPDTSSDYNQRKVQENLSKPRSSQVAAPQYGSTPLNKANAFAQGMSESDMKRLYEEMIQSAGSQ